MILCSLRGAAVPGDLHQTWKLEKRGDLAGAGLGGWGKSHRDDRDCSQ